MKITLSVLIAIVFLSFFVLPHQVMASDNPVKDAYEQGVIAFAQQDYKRAAEFFQKVVDVYPLAQAYHYLGLSQKELGVNPRKVAELFKKAIEIDPNFTDAYENLSKMCYGMGEYDDAEKYGLKAVQLNPNSVSSQLSMGWIYLLGKSDAAASIPYFEKSIQLEPSTYGYLGLGMAYIVDDQHYKTLEMITALRQMNEGSLADQLEKMMHERKLVPIRTPAGPMVVPEREAGILVRNSPVGDLEYPSVKEGEDNMEVRLRKTPKKELKGLGGPLAVGGQTGTDRIKELQSRGANAGSY